MESFQLHPPQSMFLRRIEGEILMRESMINYGEKFVKHYSSSHRILLVGEGDFSFSLSLASGFGSAINIFATSFDSYDKLINTYKKAGFNLARLGEMGATLIHEVDARKMKDHPLLNWRTFDVIVYNFPHAGFYGKEDDSNMIKMHQELVHGFFNNARSLLRPNGQIHVTHKTKHPYSCWNLEELANQNSLVLTECVPFDINDYRGYENKRGHSSTSDQPFNWKDSCTFKFTHSLYSNFQNSNIQIIKYSNIHSFTGEILPRLKFIVKGEVSPNYPRAAGYAGALVDDQSIIRARFCGPLLCYSYIDADVAALHAVKYALQMFEESDWCNRKVELVVESDSNQAVSWIKSDFGNPIELLADLQQITMALGRIRNRVEFCCSYGGYGGKYHDLVHEWAVSGMHADKMYKA